MLGGPPKPQHSEAIAFTDGNALMIENSHMIFGVRVASFRRGHVVLQCKAPIWASSVTVIVNIAQPFVRSHAAQCSCLPQKGETSFCTVLAGALIFAFSRKESPPTKARLPTSC